MIEYDLKYFIMANEWNEKYHSVLKEKNLHCRGSLNSVSLISLNADTPERGFSNIKSETVLCRRLEIVDTIEAPKRATPEKLLQAVMISKSIYENNHYLPFGNKIKFVTSEFAMKHNDKKIVNDILGFSDYGELYIIELKSSRFKKELEHQVDSFGEFVRDNSELFYELLKTYGFDWDRKSIRKAIVWNKLNNTKVIRDDILEFVYDKSLLESKEHILKIEELNAN